jgi:hypothetical protein
LHNADHGLFDEAGLPAYDADTYRTRRLSELDRAAATGHVPTGLLARWEKLLEDVTLWRFAPTPTHGDLTGDQVLAVFDDEGDAASGRVKAFTGWEDAKVADPADDFFALVTQTPPRALETVMEAYAHARAERPDAHLLTRARLSAEMRTLSQLMSAVTGGDRLLVERLAAALRRLDDRVHAEEEAANDYRRAGSGPDRTSPVLVPPVLDDAEEDEEDDVEVMFGRTADPDVDESEDESGAQLDTQDELETEDEARDDALDETSDELEDEASDELETEASDELEDETASGSVTGHDITAEIDVSSLRRPEPIEGDDPGPEFEPGYQPRS